ncbi:uncharacterized protein LOC112140584 isoform X1 [Oryzias melastigma]|uniref:uncharacterized protein LOC112140584 isoform X1 n=1 Tax=Oryzias melastigma TaxID=30732 RepID=UPI000CF821F6|nr:uncharacterized protein LOC112140584 isoform X1 [Oryzias melastigma]XP_024119341.1 uncharacterized protein LOC112140584 isoform X1 [Oryzias melastigma]
MKALEDEDHTGNMLFRAEPSQQWRSAEVYGERRSAGNPCFISSLQFNKDGMIVPHRILGSLEDFTTYLEVKGESQLLRRIPESSVDWSSDTGGGRLFSACGVGHTSIQGTIPWMRSQKQNVLSGVSSAASPHRHHSCQEAVNTIPEQSRVGAGVQVLFETLTGEPGWSVLDLQNGGCTVISYSWQRLSKEKSFPQLHYQDEKTHFHFNSSSGVICPGDSLRVEVLFVSEKPGIQAEHWQLNTTGVCQQVILIGVCLRRDPTAELQLHLRAKLEKKAVRETCQLILSQMLEKICTPGRSSSPPHLLDSEEQHLGSTKGEAESLEELEIMWREVTGREEWDLSVDTLRQCVLSLPDAEPRLGPSIREERLTKLNKILLQGSEPSELKHLHLTAVTAGRQLWRNLLDTMAVEAERIQGLLGVSEIQTWSYEDGRPAGEATNKQEDRNREKGAAGGRKSGFTTDNKRGFEPPSTGDLQVRNEKGVKDGPEGQLEGSPLPPRNPPASSSFRRMFLRKVYGLMEDLLDALCDVIDELREV